MTINTESKLALHIETWRRRHRISSWTAMFIEAGLAPGTAIPIRNGKANYMPRLETLDCHVHGGRPGCRHGDSDTVR